jgi:hypothetical protein
MTPNPKIKALIESLGIIPEDEHYEIAEQVIKECVAMCKTSVGNADYNTGRLHCLENIKEHFGVEK